jgi:hypothetical protein
VKVRSQRPLPTFCGLAVSSVFPAVSSRIATSGRSRADASLSVTTIWTALPGGVGSAGVETTRRRRLSAVAITRTEIAAPVGFLSQSVPSCGLRKLATRAGEPKRSARASRAPLSRPSRAPARSPRTSSDACRSPWNATGISADERAATETARTKSTWTRGALALTVLRTTVVRASPHEAVTAVSTTSAPASAALTLGP